MLSAGLLAAALAYSQAVTGSFVGTVTDTSGAIIPGAKVTITEVAQKVSRTALTDARGNYSFPQVAPGTYMITFTKQGFATTSRNAVPLQVNSAVRVNATLTPGSVEQTVTVTGAPPILQTESAQTGTTIGAIQTGQLPLSTNRNFQNLIGLVPGATSSSQHHSRFFNSQNSLSNEVNGTNSMGNNFQIEGVNDTERNGELQVYIPAAAAIANINIATGNYDAEQGSATGAVVNVIYKSGTNSFHGELYEIYTGNAFGSRSFFERGADGRPFVMPHSVKNYWGGNIGGPIRKDKTFFFVNFLRTTDHEGQYQRLTVPTLAERKGEFTDPAVTPIFDPATGDTADCLPGGNSAKCGTGRTQFANNMIPTNRIDPVANKILDLVPLPNSNQNLPGAAKYSQNYNESTGFTQDNSQIDVRLDHYQGDHDHISGHFGYMNPHTVQDPAYGLAGGPVAGGFEATGTDKTYSIGINWDHIFSPTLLVENRIGLNRYRNTAQQTDYGSSASSDIGIPGVNIGAFESGLTGISIGSTISNPMVGYDSGLPWIRSETDFDYVSNWNKIVGNHTFKWGANLIRIRDDLLQDQSFGPRGEWSFSSGQTALNGGPAVGFANEFASFLLDVPNQVGRDVNATFPAYRQLQMFAYFNDKWQVSSRLTLNLGLRWAFYKPATPHFAGGFSNYDPASNNLVIAGIGGNPLDLGMQKNYKDLAPRIGIAYRVTNKDVVRAGCGISYEPFLDTYYAYNFPVIQNNAFDSLSGFGPAILPDGTPAAFEKGFPAPLVAAVPRDGIIPANTSLLINQQYDVVNLRYHDPYIQSWNLTYERLLPGQLALDIGYVGNHGVAIPVEYNLNAVANPAFIGLGSTGQPLAHYCVSGTSICRTADTNLWFAGESSNYNSLQVQLKRRFSKGLSLTTSYTWGKALSYTTENGDNSGSPTYYIDFRRNYARTDFDMAQSFVQSFVWELPFGHGRRFFNAGVARVILGGWELSGILALHSGTPMSFGCNCSPMNTPGNGQSAEQVGPFKTLYGVDTQPWFDTSAFADPTVLFGKPTFGNTGLRTVSGPGFLNLDAAIFRTVKVNERFGLQLRSDWFSATNTPQFANPGTTFGSSTFGFITSAGGARSIDFGAKLTF